MSAPVASNALSSQISGLIGAVAMAIGEMVPILEVSASAASMHSSVHQPRFGVELQRRAKAQQAAAASKALLKALNKVMANINQLAFMSREIDCQVWEGRAEIIRHVEKSLDSHLMNLRIGGVALDVDIKQARKLLGLVRIKLSNIVSTMRRLKGKNGSFKSQINLEGFHALADARSENIGRRFD